VADRQKRSRRKTWRRRSARGGGRATAGVARRARPPAPFKQLASATDGLRARRIDFLFNNAGIVVAGEIDVLLPEDWDER